MADSYDSTQDTSNHINTVRVFLAAAIYNLEQRRMEHDASKLHYPEKEMYDQFTPKLKELIYGSDEYKAALAQMGPALDHHYQVNNHHPEHFDFCKSNDANVIQGFMESQELPVEVADVLKRQVVTLRSRVNGMSLFDLLEMVCDWKAASQRHVGGSLAESLEINMKRFEISEPLMKIIRNTVEEMKW